MTLPPHLKALAALTRAKVDFLLIGALALDHFAAEMAATYSTLDCDILLRPVRSNLRRAYRALTKAGYVLNAGGEPLPDLDDVIVRRILEHLIMVRAEKADSLPIDLLLAAKGFSFDAWWKGRTRFKAGRSWVPCASLEHVLESKRQAGRDKDKKLLALYAASQPHRRSGK